MQLLKYRFLVSVVGIINITVGVFLFMYKDDGFMSILAPLTLYPLTLMIYHITRKTIHDRRQSFIGSLIACMVLAIFTLISYSDGTAITDIIVTGIINILLLLPIHFAKEH